MMTTSFGDGISRRRFLSYGLAGVGGAMGAGLLASCATRAGKGEVVLYSSVDGPILKPIVAEFEQSSGIAVRLVGDTEATKSTGLIERLLLEKASPRADVWWSSEQLGAIELARAGVLEATSPKAVSEFSGGWPADLKDAGGLWYGFAVRARVLVCSTKRVTNQPKRLGDLLDERFKGRVGIANPAFGTTRVHLAALVATRGEAPTRAWLQALKDRGLKVYAGNSSVVRAVSQGEIDVGLTDTDDVHAGRANGWEVHTVFEDAVSTTDAASPAPAEFSGGGALVIPNTVARVKGGPNAANAASLIEFILSEKVERLLAASESRNAPIRADLRSQMPEVAIVNEWRVDGVSIADSLTKASSIARDVLGPDRGA